jgi:hypothetical protein
MLWIPACAGMTQSAGMRAGGQDVLLGTMHATVASA